MFMTFEKFALKQPFVSMRFLLSFTYFFVMKLMWQVSNSHTNIFGLKTFGQTSPRTIQGSLRKDPCWQQKLPMTVPPTDGKRLPAAWSTSRRWSSLFGTYTRDIISYFQASKPIDGGQDGSWVDRRPVDGQPWTGSVFSAPYC